MVNFVHDKKTYIYIYIYVCLLFIVNCVMKLMDKLINKLKHQHCTDSENFKIMQNIKSQLLESRVKLSGFNP